MEALPAAFATAASTRVHDPGHRGAFQEPVALRGGLVRVPGRTPASGGHRAPLQTHPRQQPALSLSALGFSLSSPDPSPLCSVS